MTPEAQRIAIAEACPTAIRANTTDSGYWPGNPKWEWYDGERWHQCHKNDPHADLNAMHEAEKVLTEMQWHRYLQELARVVREKGQAEIRISQYVRATAAQRAEAFLRTLNLWKE